MPDASHKRSKSEMREGEKLTIASVNQVRTASKSKEKKKELGKRKK